MRSFSPGACLDENTNRWVRKFAPPRRRRGCEKMQQAARMNAAHLPRLAVILFAVACGEEDPAGADAPAQQVDAPAAPRQTVAEAKALGIGELVEGTLVGGPADRAVISLSAPVNLDWNIHGHAGGGTQTVEEQLGVRTVSYTFVPPAQADWSLLLRNAGGAPTSVQVEIELYGDMQWQSWQ
jgi:hypothetical protein